MQRRWPCLTDDSFIVHCIHVDSDTVFGDGDVKADGVLRFSESATIYKFEDWAELAISRGADGWLTFDERVYIAALRCLSASSSSNGGMKCRCRARKGHVNPGCISGSALKYAFGPFVTELCGRGIPLGAMVKFKRVKDSPVRDAFRMPAVGDQGMIDLVEKALHQVLVDAKTEAEVEVGHETRMKWARSVWNNLFGGRLMFAGVEARLERWSMLLPSSASASTSLSQSLSPPQSRSGAYIFTVMDYVRREIEAELFRRHWQLASEIEKRAKAAADDDDEDISVGTKAGVDAIKEKLLSESVIISHSAVRGLNVRE
jgi:hypothetical protein